MAKDMSISPKIIDAFLTGTVWTCYELFLYFLYRTIKKPNEVS